VQWIDANGRARLIGLGSVEDVAGDGGVVTRMVTPGLALRLVPSGHRFGIGWMETMLFQSAPAEGPRRVLAIADRAYGVALDPTGIVVGTEGRFLVLDPGDAPPTVQEIRYQSGRPSADWLRYQEGR
jgi:hypothetical protein